MELSGGVDTYSELDTQRVSKCAAAAASGKNIGVGSIGVVKNFVTHAKERAHTHTYTNWLPRQLAM